MGSRALDPTLVPTVRQTPYLDFQALSPYDVSNGDRLIDEMVKSGEVRCLSTAEYYKVSIVLRERRRQAQCAANITYAGVLDHLQRELSSFHLESKLFKGKAHTVDAIEGQYLATLERLNQVERQRMSELDDLFAKRRKAFDDLLRSTTSRIQAFDSKIPDQVPPEFTRLSADLLDLREKEKHLLGSRRFEEAAQLHKEFRKRQFEELIRRREEYFLHMEKKRAEVVGLNKRELVALDTDWAERVALVKHRAGSELAPLREALARLLKKLVTAKAEYIGGDDPILKLDPSLDGARTSGNQFKAVRPPGPKTHARSGHLVGATRPWSGLANQPMTTRQLSSTLSRSIAEPDGRRWP